MIRETRATLAEKHKNVHMIETDSFPCGGLHFGREGPMAVGKAFAEAYLDADKASH